MKRKQIPPELKPFEEGQLCYVVWRRAKGTGRYKLLLHQAAVAQHGVCYGHSNCWAAECETTKLLK